MSSFGISTDKILATSAMNLANEAEKTSEKTSELKRKREECAKIMIEAAKEFNKYGVELLQLNIDSKFQEALKHAKTAVREAPENKKAKREKLVQTIIEQQKTFLEKNSSPPNFIRTDNNNTLKLNLYQSNTLAEDGITPIPIPKPTPPKQSLPPVTSKAIPPVTPKNAKSQNSSTSSNTQASSTTHIVASSSLNTTRIQAKPIPPQPQQQPGTPTSRLSTQPLTPSRVTRTTMVSVPIPSPSKAYSSDNIYERGENAENEEMEIRQNQNLPEPPKQRPNVTPVQTSVNLENQTEDRQRLIKSITDLNATIIRLNRYMK